MAGAVIVEGTWDEVLAHADEFRGKRVQVTVLPEPQVDGETGSLYDFLGDFIGSLEGSGTNYSDDTGKKFADDMAEKHRQGHL